MSGNSSRDSMESLESSSSDTDSTEGVGLRSPGALSSGRTVKEIDEQLSSLKKENFNLKLRIYFLEEGMGSNFSAVKEDIMKKNIELQVELANLQKELENKQELLCQAAKAMEIEEDENKKEIGIRDQEIHKLKEMLENIQYHLKNERDEIKQVALCAEAFDLNIAEDDSLDIIKKLQVKIQDLQEELKNERDRTGHCSMMAENVREKCKSLEMQVSEKNSEITLLTSELQQNQDAFMEYTKRINTLEEMLSEQNALLEDTNKLVTTKDVELNKQNATIEEINKLYVGLLEERNKLEKRMEKYRWQCCMSEKKNEELSAHAGSLKNKIHNLETRARVSAEDGKKLVMNESIASTDEKLNCKNNDVSIFSVRITPRVPECSSKAISPKPSSPLKFTKAHSPPNNLFCDAEDDVSSKTHKSDKKRAEFSEVHESLLTHDEIIELKKNHFKACKIIKTMIQKKKEYVEQIDKLQKSVVEKGDEIKILKKKITESELKSCLSGDAKKKSIKEKVSELNLTASLNPSAAKESLMARDDMELSERYKELAYELEEKIELLNATLAEKDLQLERFKMDIQEKADRIIDLEFEVLTFSNGVNDESKENAIDEKEHKIQKLESELRKRTGDLQGIVNNELWEKNRTIEKLQILIKTKDETISNLEKTNNNINLQLQILKEKINELGIHINLPSEFGVTPNQYYEQERNELLQQIEKLKLRLNNVPEHENKQTELLQSQCERLREDLDKSEKLRLEECEICAILNTRLEELCHFLKSLLRHKTVFGFLGNEQSRQLHQALNKSLEFSQILSNSICADESLLQESAITNLLNSTRNDNISFTNLIEEENATLSIIPKDITLTYRSHLNRINNESDVITVLRQQIANLKHEIEVRDVELERVRNEPSLKVGDLEKSPSKKQDNHSESESWSEPDRSVSLARIGLEDESLKRPNCRRKCIGEPSVSSASTEDEKNLSKTPSKRVTLAESRQTIIALHEQICEMETSLKQKDDQLVSIQMAHYETDKLLKLEQDKLQTLMDENRKLLITIAEYSTEAEESRELMDQLRIEQTQLIAQLGCLKKEMDIVKMQKSELEQKIAELNYIIETLEEFKRTTLLNNSIKDKQMQNTLNEMEIERSKLIETSKNLENALEKVKLDLQKAQVEFQRICVREEQVRQQLEKREGAFLKKEEESFNAIQVLKRDYESKLLEMKQNHEKELKSAIEHLQIIINKDAEKFHGLEDKFNDLHKELNNINLQYSEIMLEKSKMKNENNVLQNTVQKLREQEALLSEELNAVVSKYSKKLSDMENQNLTITSQLSELRKTQADCKSFSMSLPNHLSIFHNGSFVYKRQISDHSGYVSEDVPVDQIEKNRIMDIIGQNISVLDAIEDQDRLNATSSPDLGIESDQGRFSSLEANINVHRPFLPSLEIAQNMNELLDPVEDISCANEECCKKAKQIANENVDLRKRLLRTRRALEDTLTRLTLANKQKKEVEKSICKQIHKTSQVLRKAKANLDSGSETDNVKS